MTTPTADTTSLAAAAAAAAAVAAPDTAAADFVAQDTGNTTTAAAVAVADAGDTGSDDDDDGGAAAPPATKRKRKAPAAAAAAEATSTAPITLEDTFWPEWMRRVYHVSALTPGRLNVLEQHTLTRDGMCEVVVPGEPLPYTKKKDAALPSTDAAELPPIGIENICLMRWRDTDTYTLAFFTLGEDGGTVAKSQILTYHGGQQATTHLYAVNPRVPDQRARLASMPTPNRLTLPGPPSVTAPNDPLTVCVVPDTEYDAEEAKRQRDAAKEAVKAADAIAGEKTRRRRDDARAARARAEEERLARASDAAATTAANIATAHSRATAAAAAVKRQHGGIDVDDDEDDEDDGAGAGADADADDDAIDDTHDAMAHAEAARGVSKAKRRATAVRIKPNTGGATDERDSVIARLQAQIAALTGGVAAAAPAAAAAAGAAPKRKHEQTVAPATATAAQRVEAAKRAAAEAAAVLAEAQREAEAAEAEERERAQSEHARYEKALREMRTVESAAQGLGAWGEREHMLHSAAKVVKDFAERFTAHVEPLRDAFDGTGGPQPPLGNTDLALKEAVRTLRERNGDAPETDAAVSEARALEMRMCAAIDAAKLDAFTDDKMRAEVQGAHEHALRSIVNVNKRAEETHRSATDARAVLATYEGGIEARAARLFAPPAAAAEVPTPAKRVVKNKKKAADAEAAAAEAAAVAAAGAPLQQPYGFRRGTLPTLASEQTDACCEQDKALESMLLQYGRDLRGAVPPTPAEHFGAYDIASRFQEGTLNAVELEATDFERAQSYTYSYMAYVVAPKLLKHGNCAVSDLARIFGDGFFSATLLEFYGNITDAAATGGGGAAAAAAAV